MTDSFLSVKESAALTGKSTSSIRRLIHPLLKSEGHPDRIHLRPTPDEALQLRLKGETFQWRISEDWLLRVAPPSNTGDKKANSTPRSNHELASLELLAILNRELEIKNVQIADQSSLLSKQAELVAGLSQRLQEGNVILASLQHRLALSEGRVEVTKLPVETEAFTVTKPNRPEKGSSPLTKSTKPKKSLLARWFH